MMNPVIAVILARKNSKGIPQKNLCKVGGRSLLAIAIEAAIDSGLFDHIVVSTDGEQIAGVARQYPGVRVLSRPEILATDTAKSIGAMLNVFEQLGINSGTAILLQPTSPLRTAQHIYQAFHLFKQQDAGCVVSACRPEHHPYKMLVQVKDKYMPIDKLASLEEARQKLPPVVWPNGAIYINRIEDLLQHQAFYIEPVSVFEMSTVESIDIDNLADLQKAEQIVRKNM